MMNIRTMVFFAMLGMVIGFLSACSGADCESLCTEAQSRDCTSISGDCAAFCASVDKVSASASCDTQKDAYQSCLGDGDVCTGDSRCSSEQTALGNCASAYCLANMNDADCQRVVASF